MSDGLQQVYDEAMVVRERTDENASHDAMARSVEAMDAALGFEVMCARHGVPHPISIRDLERLVYALQGQLSDALTEPEEDRQEKDQPGSEVANGMCPLDSLQLAGDSEGYAEHVESMVESRLATVRR